MTPEPKKALSFEDDLKQSGYELELDSRKQPTGRYVKDGKFFRVSSDNKSLLAL